MVVVVTLETVVIAVLAVLVAGLLRSHAEILRRLHDLGAGLDPADPAPGSPRPGDRPSAPTPENAAARSLGVAVDIAGVTPSGDAAAVGVAGAPQRTLVAFLSSGCSTCSNLWRALRATGTEAPLLPGGPRVVVVTRDATEESPPAVANLAPEGSTVVMSSRAWVDYGVPGAPYFVLVDGPTATIVGEGTASSWTQLADLVAQAFSDDDSEPAVRDRTASGDGGPERGAAIVADDGGRFLSGPQREARADSELAASGILPGDPSLHSRHIGDVFPTGPDHAATR